MNTLQIVFLLIVLAEFVFTIWYYYFKKRNTTHYIPNLSLMMPLIVGVLASFIFGNMSFVGIMVIVFLFVPNVAFYMHLRHRCRRYVESRLFIYKPEESIVTDGEDPPFVMNAMFVDGDCLKKKECVQIVSIEKANLAKVRKVEYENAINFLRVTWIKPPFAGENEYTVWGEVCLGEAMFRAFTKIPSLKYKNVGVNVVLLKDKVKVVKEGQNVACIIDRINEAGDAEVTLDVKEYLL